MRTAQGLIAVFLTGFLAGCTSGDYSHPTFVLSGLSFAPSPIVNLTDQDLPLYPPLKELLGKWEAANGTYGEYSMPYPYEDGLATVKKLQARMPGTNWPSDNAVPIAYKGKAFMAGPSRTVTD